MIGPLQTNKVKKALEIFDFFHSLDRQNLAIEFSKHPNNIKHKSFFIGISKYISFPHVFIIDLQGKILLIASAVGVERNLITISHDVNFKFIEDIYT